MTRLLRLALTAAVAAVLTGSASGDVARCSYGVSSVGPVVLVGGHVTGDTAPRTEACLGQG